MRDSKSFKRNLQRQSRSRSLSYESEDNERRRYRRNRESVDNRTVRRDNHDKLYNKRRGSRSLSPSSSSRYDNERARSSSRDRNAYRTMPSSRDRDTYRGGQNRDTSPSREHSKKSFSRTIKGPLPSQDLSFRANHRHSIEKVTVDEEYEKQKPNLAPTGLLAAASNSIVKADGTAIALKYHEPLEARKPLAKDDWKLFVFKGSEILETIELRKRSGWLIGRDSTVADILTEHPSISKQHAVIQFRYIEKKNEYGDRNGRVRPYLIDLDSANSTLLNKEEIPGSRYLELRDKDMIQFGHSSREYVLMLAPKK